MNKFLNLLLLWVTLMSCTRTGVTTEPPTTGDTNQSVSDTIQTEDNVKDSANDIYLSVGNIILDWGGAGGEINVSENSCTFPNWANNYWLIENLNTNEYTCLDFMFAQPVNYYRIKVKAIYSDNTEQETEVDYGATEYRLIFESGKTIVKIVMMQGDWEKLNADKNGEDITAKIYFKNIIIRTKESAISTEKPKTTIVASPKLSTGAANPILDFQFCADPTAVEYNGRLYVYGTNDHQQYEEAEKNSYEKIRTLTMMSTDDMVNWTYHGLIPVGEIAPWIIASWAPSIISKQQPDGSTLFSLYFSNSGWGVGVIQAKSPVGPWTSPLQTSLIDGGNSIVAGSGSIFDPGAVIDTNDNAWLSFGNSQGWIAKLNPDLHSFATDPVKIPSPYHFEANELNYINGVYVYTYNNDWSDHTPWNLGGEKPTACSMIYMKSTEPLNINSWTYGGNYFKNPGENGMGYGNNHTHLHKYQGKWYLFYHTGLLGTSLGTDGGFRSIYVDEIEVDEQNIVINECKPTHKGVSAIKNLNPYELQYAATSAATLGILYKQTDKEGHMVATVGTTCKTAEIPAEGIIEVRNVDFSNKGNKLKCLLKGKGSVMIRLDDKNGKDIANINSTEDKWQERTVNTSHTLNGVHTIYIILKGDVQLDTWQFLDV